jgi:hypothetical protein
MSDPSLPSDGQPAEPAAATPLTPAPAPTPRPRLSPSAENPETGRPDPSSLTPHQAAMRAAMMDAFNAKKARRFVERNVQHIATNRDLADGIKFLFDEHGRSPENAPLEEIIEERKRVEYQLKWFEGILLELRNRLVKIKEVEDYALEMLSRAFPED